MQRFSIASDGINPSTVPTRTMRSGAKIPAIGLGTFGSDKYDANIVADAVVGAASVGYRHFDCASVYGNEDTVGTAFKEILTGGLRREDLWVTSKVWNDMHHDVELSCQKSLSDLGLDYLDLFLVHWPFPNSHGRGVDVSSRDPHAKSYIHDDYMKTWSKMESLVKAGLVKHIGTSNMTLPKLELVLRDASIKPEANEMEMHPHFQQPELFHYCLKNEIVPIGYSPIGSPSRPERDRTPDDTVDIDDPTIRQIAQRIGVHPAVLCVKWAVQNGQIPIPFSVKPEQYLQTLKAVISEPLTTEDMAAISQIDKNNRLIKGHVFLWKDGQSWEDLWDIDGQITPA